MLAKDGRILYVGKATSLKSRVNSYFRGQKGRDKRKLEMLAQVWDLNVTECATPLEAALLETDEIKRWNPPYNVSLKMGSRRILFYSRDFTVASESQDADCPIGPFRPQSILDSLRLLQHWLQTGELGLIFYRPMDAETVSAGFELFCEHWGRPRDYFAASSFRRLLAIGMLRLREFIKRHPGENMEDVFAREKEKKEEDEDLKPLDVCGKIERLFLRSAFALRRCRQMTRLLNADVRIRTEEGERTLSFRKGKMAPVASPRPRWPWAGADVADFDRMSILLSEVQRNSYPVETRAL